MRLNLYNFSGNQSLLQICNPHRRFRQNCTYVSHCVSREELQPVSWLSLEAVGNEQSWGKQQRQGPIQLPRTHVMILINHSLRRA